MVQGKIKGIQAKKQKASRPSGSSSTKKGQRYIPPKNPAALKMAALRKGLSAKIGRSIEQNTAAAASAGKLTIMKNVALENTKAKSSQITTTTITKKPTPSTSKRSWPWKHIYILHIPHVLRYVRPYANIHVHILVIQSSRIGDPSPLTRQDLYRPYLGPCWHAIPSGVLLIVAAYIHSFMSVGPSIPASCVPYVCLLRHSGSRACYSG